MRRRPVVVLTGGALLALLGLAGCGGGTVVASQTLNSTDSDAATANDDDQEDGDINQAATAFVSTGNQLDYRGYAPRTRDGAVIHVFNGDAPDPRVTTAAISR